MTPDVNDPLFWVDRLSQRLMARQAKYRKNANYAEGNHPVPTGDRRFRRVLEELQRKAITNYVGLAIKAITDRMAVKGFRFGDPREFDKDARRIWNANNMSLQSVTAIRDAATLSDTYALVSPPAEEGGDPIITIEDPRTCITEPDPTNPLRGIAALKFYEDTVLGFLVAVLYRPDYVYVYYGPTLHDFTHQDLSANPGLNIAGAGGWDLVSTQINPLGMVPLVRGAWQPDYGVMGMAECEDGGHDIQDRINATVLHRMVIARNQAFRQKWMTGARTPKSRKGGGAPKENPFKPESDIVWAVPDEKARFGDFEQADIRQLLEAVRDDVGDFAAITQTPVMYLTNKMVNVSADTMTAAQISLVKKIESRSKSLGWFFEEVMKLAFRYKGDARAEMVEAETVWEDPEARSMAEVADMIAKAVPAGMPIEIVGEWAGLTEDQIKLAVEKAEEAKAEEQAMLEKQAQLKQQSQKPNDSSR